MINLLLMNQIDSTRSFFFFNKGRFYDHGHGLPMVPKDRPIQFEPWRKEGALQYDKQTIGQNRRSYSSLQHVHLPTSILSNLKRLSSWFKKTVTLNGHWSFSGCTTKTNVKQTLRFPSWLNTIDQPCWFDYWSCLLSFLWIPKKEPPSPTSRRSLTVWNQEHLHHSNKKPNCVACAVR
jgi:hypothetical protein